ncbi:ADP-ribosylglycohydrolase family protein [Corynebacterium aquatimens]|uniref:ADP-ribosylglycohydrolase family protein n=1 Tax=Corynebacterium TaxID=1716 RepID=UPI001F174C62|nr:MULTISPECIES: ADP-ribosylglycohydrolase family protein [Corynebacterium]QYH19966.1 ADP-ribosylglycohydrolase family protein [Corynebacterium aquatimens]UIZ92852.1 ADP-ribosylglycohydrolase family protein [Corynebacterium sp. CNCTC7651]
MPTPLSPISRARGVLFGQVIGDNLGALVEFSDAASIRAAYPGGVRELTGGGPHYVAPGQPTDDSELALALARSLLRNGGFDKDDVQASYRRWAASHPFDIGNTCRAALREPFHFDPESKSNGALMRVSPLAIAYAGAPGEAGSFARADATFTHVNPYPGDVNAVYVAALADVIAGADPVDALLAHAGPLRDEVEAFTAALPEDVQDRNGFVRHAFHLTCYHAAHATSFEEALVEVIAMSGDTDTNAAIVGAFLGGVMGEDAIPQRWRDTITAYRPEMGGRPEEYSPHDIVALAEGLFALSAV